MSNTAVISEIGGVDRDECAAGGPTHDSYLLGGTKVRMTQSGTCPLLVVRPVGPSRSGWVSVCAVRGCRVL